jgi:hypothetical protein
LRKAAGYVWTDYTTDSEIAKEINITTLLGKIQEYRRNSLQHIKRTTRNKLPGIIKSYRTTGIRNQEQPIKRLLDV